jgi:Flp pilus assembly protein TadG
LLAHHHGAREIDSRARADHYRHHCNTEYHRDIAALAPQKIACGGNEFPCAVHRAAPRYSGCQFPPKDVNMPLISGKPVTQILTKPFEPLTPPNNRLEFFMPGYDCRGVLNLLLSMPWRLTSFRRRLVLKKGAKRLCTAVKIPARFSSNCRRMRTDANKGSVAIEFAMIAPIFLLILMATIETGVVFFAQTALQNAVNDAARLVKTGQTACFTKDAGNACVRMTADQFRTKICDEVIVLLHVCNKDAGGNSNLQFDVKAYSAGFGGVSNSSPLDNNGDLPNMTAFDTGQACDVVLVRAFYRWPIATPFLGFLLANMSGSDHLLTTAAAFRSEPYVNNVGGC